MRPSTGGSVVCLGGPSALPLRPLRAPTVFAHLLRTFLPVTLILMALAPGLTLLAAAMTRGPYAGLCAALLILGSGLIVTVLCRRTAERLGRTLDDAQTKVRREADQRHLAERHLQASKMRYRLLVDGVADYALYMIDAQGRVTSWNPGAERLYGFRSDEIVGLNFDALYPPEALADGQAERDLDEAARTGRAECEGWRLRQDSSRFWAVNVFTALRDEAGGVPGFSVLTRDLTERRRAEDQLRQAQKLDALGRLAGGIAHDFNNILTVITGYSGLLLQQLAPDHPMRNRIRDIRAASLRGASLTNQLLAYSRRQPVQRVVLDIGEAIAQMHRMLTRLLPENIALHVETAATHPHILADRGQIEQMVMNLVLNARDSMPQGGRIEVRTEDTTRDDAATRRHVDLRPGAHVRIVVRDTGSGMDDRALAHLFEPFFTTKEKGKGTGLGLATVYATVKQNEGDISVQSAPGRGTTFTILFPQNAAAAREAISDSRLAMPGGSEKILVVEDDSHTLATICAILQDRGYEVFRAADPAEAMDVHGRHAPFQLLIADIVMPAMSGTELAAELTSAAPRMKVLYISGHVDPSMLATPAELHRYFLQKPFTPSSLLVKVREVLDRHSDVFRPAAQPVTS